MSRFAARFVNYIQKKLVPNAEKEPLLHRHKLSGGTQAAQHLLTDSIHERLDGQCVHDTPASSMKRLRKVITKRLTPKRYQTLSDGVRSTQFANISAYQGNRADNKGNRNLYHLAGIAEPRTQEEIELHILLQSQVRVADPAYRHTGDSLMFSTRGQLVEAEPMQRQARRVAPAPVSTAKTPTTANTPNAAKTSVDASSISSNNYSTTARSEPIERARPVEPTASTASSTNAARSNTATSAAPTIGALSGIPEARNPVPISEPSTWPEPMPPVRAMPLPAITESADGSGSNSATSSPRADANTIRGVLDYEDDFGNQMRRYGPKAVDMKVVNDRLFGTDESSASHALKAISGAGAHCWWRCGVLAAIQQKSPEEIEHLISGLGTGFEEHAEAFKQMSRAVREEGPHAILTGIRMEDRTTDMEQPSKIKRAWLTQAEDGGRGEELCQEVVDALLERAGVGAPERMETVFGGHSGDAHLIVNLLRQLQCNAAVMSVPWTQFQAGTDATPDMLRASIEICAQPGSMLDTSEPSDSLQQFANNLANGLDGVPLIRHQGGHFNFAGPKIDIDMARHRYYD